MVFYIIAASDKDTNGAPKSEQAVEAKIKATKSFKGPQATEVHRLAIDKSQFKIGSLDQLMALNESAAKLDTTVDLACKKLEKICFDTGSTNLEYHDEIEDKKMSYKEYIQKFSWNLRKFNLKLSLSQLCDLSTKIMKDMEARMKKDQEEVNGIRQKYQALLKKDSGNLTVRDFTDDIYNKPEITQQHFIEGFGSELFTNILVVLNKTKLPLFLAELLPMMDEYYKILDNAEEKRHHDQAKIQFNEIKERGGEAWIAFVAKHELRNGEEINDEKGIAVCEHLMKDASEKKKHQRMPGVIVPTSGHDLKIEDKDGNIVFRYIVYKAQAEDAIKALRRKGYTSKVFSYDRAAWENENAQRIILKDQLEVKTTLLNETARSCFQQTFVALMHLKVVRAYIDGVLRFGIPPRFYLGIVIPKKGSERLVLQEMTEVLAEPALKEMYGEKLDSSEVEDFWPFVSISLSSPQFLHQTSTQ